MKFAFTILFIMASLHIFSQQVDSRSIVKSPRDADAAEPLAYALTYRCKNEMEKVTAIFNWITQNISYQVRPWYNRNNKVTSKFQVEDPSDTATILKPLNERVADLVIRRREAYCDGYARLFKTLCDYSGIHAEIITGYSQTGAGNGAKFRSNHTWNAVRIDSAWHLLDVTWASGFITFSSNEYIQRYNDYYFLTPPAVFINDHYPEDLQWTLLPQPPTLHEYNASPFKQQGYIRTKVIGYTPEKGVIKASVGDTLYFELVTDQNNKEYQENNVAEDTEQDEPPVFVQHPANWINIHPAKVERGKLYYAYPVSSDTISYINLFFNDHSILRYRLNIVKPNISVAAN